MTRKVLILSASTGGGHNRAARAVQEEAEKLGLECKIVDSLKFVSKMVDTVISKGYETSALYTPKPMEECTEYQIQRLCVREWIKIYFLNL